MSQNPDLGKTGNSVWNQPFVDELTTNFFPNMDVTTIQHEQDRFLEYYPEWIASSKLNQFRGLEDFPKRYVSLGVTQALDWWHNWCLSQNLRLKIFRGEYPYNRDVWLGEYMGWDKSIDDTGLERGDAVIISVPFSSNGRKPDRWKWLIEECNAKDIPVFVDCAWFGTCFDIEVKLNHPCIKMVAFSTGKGLSCGNWRAGIVFSRMTDDDRCSLELQTEWRHGIHLNVAIANHLMAKYGPDTMPKKYMEAHAAVCNHYGFETTNTIHIAVAPQTPDWNAYHRDETVNRVNIAKAIKRWKNNGTFAE
jgi:hypothetical protein